MKIYAHSQALSMSQKNTSIYIYIYLLTPMDCATMPCSYHTACQLKSRGSKHCEQY